MNLTTMKKYTEGLNFDAYSRAMLTGIAIGWVCPRNHVYTGEQDMIAACTQCDFCVRARWRKPALEWETERILITRMTTEARGRGCTHWRKFVEYLYESGTHWHNWIADENAFFPTLRMSTHAERLALVPRTGYGEKAKQLVDAVAMAQITLEQVK